LIPSCNARSWRSWTRRYTNYNTTFSPHFTTLLRLNHQFHAEVFPLLYPKWHLQLSLHPCPHDLGSANFFTPFLTTHHRLPLGFQHVRTLSLTFDFFEADSAEAYTGAANMLALSACNREAMPGLRSVNLELHFGSKFMFAHRSRPREEMGEFKKALRCVPCRHDFERVTFGPHFDPVRTVWGLDWVEVRSGMANMALEALMVPVRSVEWNGLCQV
jgi:hypothetical protein